MNPILIWMVALTTAVVVSADISQNDEIAKISNNVTQYIPTESHPKVADNDESSLEDHVRAKREYNDRPYYKRRVPPGVVGLGGFRSFGKGYAVRGRGFGYPSRGYAGRVAGGRSAGRGSHGGAAHGVGHGGHARG